LAGNPGHQVNKDRFSGFLAAFTEAGIEWDESAAHWNLAGISDIERVMPTAMASKPECLVCMDDVICVRVLSWLQKNHYEVPADTRIASLHDSAFMEAYNPPVSALHIYVPDLGSTAGNTLLDMIGGQEVPRVNRVGYEVLSRDSTRSR